MNDQELFRQLHNLSKMAPDQRWKASQRSLLLSQIDAVDTQSSKDYSLGDFFVLPLNALRSFSQPIIAMFVLGFLFLSGGFFSLRAAQNTKPGDSLYVAKIVGEKTQLALAFTEKRKAQLGLSFAANRAIEIKKVIREEEESLMKEDKVEQLVNDYKNEISAAKNRIGKITGADNTSKKQETGKPDSIVQNNDEKIEVANNTKESDGGGKIFSAGSSKTSNGLEVSDGTGNTLKDNQTTDNKPEPAKASTTTTKEPEAKPLVNPEAMLEQASKLLNADAFNEALDVLNDAGAIDINVPKGEVKGVAESLDDEGKGTSTHE